MILGMTLSAFTLFHVVLSLVGIASGLIVVYGLIFHRSANAPGCFCLADDGRGQAFSLRAPC
jgi:hypothetical protein